MHLIVCLDDRNGMLFGGKRQSMDLLLRQRILQIVGNNKLWMNDYSARQFTESSDAICVCADFLSKAGENDYCFVENADFISCLPKTRKLIIYRWNRVYPSDVKFPAEELSARQKVSVFEFPGHSHDRITEEVYTQ